MLPKHHPGHVLQKHKSHIPRKRELLFQNNLLSNKVESTASALLRNEVFSVMTPDKVTEVAQKDRPIVALGESWLRRNIDNELKRKYYASQHMRHCAKLLLHAHKTDNQEDKPSGNSEELWEYIRPAYMDTIVQAALDTAVRNMDDEEDLKSPSNAIKIKYDLLRLTNIKIVISLREFDQDRGNKMWKEANEEAEGFLIAVKVEWSEKVTRLARKQLNERKLNKVTELPNPKDIEQLSKHLREELTADDVYEGKPFWATYRRVIQLTQTRLLTYNKRRSGELEAIQ